MVLGYPIHRSTIIPARTNVPVYRQAGIRTGLTPVGRGYWGKAQSTEHRAQCSGLRAQEAMKR